MVVLGNGRYHLYFSQEGAGAQEMHEGQEAA